MISRKNIAVFGIYPDQLLAEDAVENLKAAGFRSTDVSILFPDSQGARDFTHERHTKAPEGAVTGGGSGALIGGALGWLAGAGALAVPGADVFVSVGPLMGMLGGIGTGFAIGGAAGALIGRGIPEYEARRYEGRVRRGGILLSVHCDDSEWTARAREILRQTGAEDIAAAGEAVADFGAAERPRLRNGPAKDYVSAGGEERES
jgi:hypothetical protein